jgi:hypothetical protein
MKSLEAAVETPRDIFHGMRVPEVRCGFGRWEKTFDTSENEQWRDTHQALYKVSFFPTSTEVSFGTNFPIITDALLDYLADLGMGLEKPYETNSTNPAVRKYLASTFFGYEIWFNFDMYDNTLEINPKIKDLHTFQESKAAIEMFLDDLHAYAQSKQTREL